MTPSGTTTAPCTTSSRSTSRALVRRRSAVTGRWEGRLRARERRACSSEGGAAHALARSVEERLGERPVVRDARDLVRVTELARLDEEAMEGSGRQWRHPGRHQPARVPPRREVASVLREERLVQETHEFVGIGRRRAELDEPLVPGLRLLRGRKARGDRELDDLRLG